MIQSEWDSPAQNYIYFVFAGRWNWEELGAAALGAREMAFSSKRPVCYIIHFLDEIGRRHVPVNILAYAMNVKINMPPNVMRIIIVNASSVSMGIMSVVFRLAPDLREFYTFASTLEEAQRMALVGGQATDIK